MSFQKQPRRQAAHEIQGATVQVRNDDVNGALRRLKKILDSDDRQRELSKREYHEKGSIKRKRARDQAAKRTQREEQKSLRNGEIQYNKPTNLKWMKGKRPRRKVMDAESIAQMASKNRS